MEKKNKLGDIALDAAVYVAGGWKAYLIKKGIEKYQEHKEHEMQSQQEQSKAFWDDWSEYTENLCNYRLQDRKAIMFLPDKDINTIWSNIPLCYCEVAYLRSSDGVPLGISVEGNVEDGVLYVYDPRDDTHYYPASEISQVLIKDKFREIKQVFESLGATQIDITFSALEDEKDEYNSNNSENLSGRYGGHKASASHNGSRTASKHSTNFRHLEIHKQCTGKTSHINFNDCYWYQQDEIFRSEVHSIKSGSTLETTFVDQTKSYCSMTATSMDKIEAEYEYMKSIGISGMAQWDKSSMQEISQTVVWDVHILCSNNNNDVNNNKIDNTMITWNEFFEPGSDEYEILESEFNYFMDNGWTIYIPDDVAEEEMDDLNNSLSGDDEFDSMINMLKAVVGLLNEKYEDEGREALQTALRQDNHVNYNDKYNLALAYEAKSATSYADYESIVNRFKNGRNNWYIINEIFSIKVSEPLECFISDIQYDDDATSQQMQILYDAFRLTTLLPSIHTAVDGWRDWCDFYIDKNDPNAFNCAKTAFDKYSVLKPAATVREEIERDTISYYDMGSLLICLGRCYYIGLGVAQDYVRAFELFREAYDMHNKDERGRANQADSYLIECYKLGRGVNADVKKVIEIYQERLKFRRTQLDEDPDNLYLPFIVKACENEIKALQAGHAEAKATFCVAEQIKATFNFLEQEYVEKYIIMLEGGEIGPRERESLERLRASLDISVSRAAELESLVGKPTLSVAEQEYLDEYREILAEGEIRERDRHSLERLAQRKGISPSRAAELESSVGTPTLSAAEQEYLDEYREVLAEGEISERDRRSLERLAQRKGISPSRAAELEQMA